MSKVLSNQDGFSPIDILVVIVALVAIGIAIYFAASHKTKTTAPLATTTANSSVSSSPTPSPAVPSPTPSPATAVSTSGYLVITQWGVMMPASGVLANLKYQIIDGAVQIYSSDLYPKYSYCGPATVSSAGLDTAVGLGTITRYATGFSASTLDQSKIATINGYDYFYSAAQSSCTEANGQNPSPADVYLNTEESGAFGPAALKLVAAP